MKRVILILIALIGLSFSTLAQVYKYKTTSTDIERGDAIVSSKNVTSYFTVDLNNKRITYEGLNSKGEKNTVTYSYKNSYKHGVSTVFSIGEKGVKEIWLSDYSAGLDFYDRNTRVACYNVVRIK
jgi:uncharacterized protein YxeA